MQKYNNFLDYQNFQPWNLGGGLALLGLQRNRFEQF